jgi:hypothetical protein
LIGEVGPDGGCHDIEIDPGRELLHAAYISGEFVGYVIYDLRDPRSPEELSRVDYAELPDYEEIGEPGFESCHQASFDPDRDLAVVGDEIGSGIPGGKHIYDIGWDEGSPENPIHIGFTHLPNAREQGDDEPFFLDDALPQRRPLRGRYHPACRRRLPRRRLGRRHHRSDEPTHAQSYSTHEDEDLIAQLGSGPVVELLDGLHPPFVWSIEYNEARNFVFASDSLTGAYTFDLSPERFEFRTIEAEIKHTYEPRDKVGANGLELAHHYHAEHATVPNTGGEEMTDEALAEIEATAEAEGVEVDAFEMEHH